MTEQDADKFADLVAENEALKARQQELLATIVRLTNETPYPEEVKTALEQRGALLAEIGTLRAKLAQLKPDKRNHGAVYHAKARLAKILNAKTPAKPKFQGEF
jgi:hypothetical protein